MKCQFLSVVFIFVAVGMIIYFTSLPTVTADPIPLPFYDTTTIEGVHERHNQRKILENQEKIGRMLYLIADGNYRKLRGMGGAEWEEFKGIKVSK